MSKLSSPILDLPSIRGIPAAWPAGIPALLRRWRRALAARRLPADVSAGNHAANDAAAEVGACSRADWRDVRASLGGDGEAYARLVRRYQNDVAACMWRFTRDRGQWEDLVHDVFVEAYLSLGSYRGEAPWLHWLRRIATRVGYRWWKTRDRQQARAIRSLDARDAGTLAEADEGAAREAGETVHLLLGRMSPRDRLVLTFVYLDGCSVAETAQRTGWSQVMVRVQIHRARKRLAKLCEQWEAES